MSTLLVDSIQPFSSGSLSVNITASYALSSGGGTGLMIPQPIVYNTKINNYGSSTIPHAYNNPLSSLGDGSGLPGAITSSWTPQSLKLTYQTGDLSFLAHNPKYFLFIYNSAGSYGSKGTHPARSNNNKYGKFFSHPPNITGSLNTTVVNNAAYANFSGNDFIHPYTDHDFSSFSTEWGVNANTGQPTILSGFNPLRFYWTSYSFTEKIAREFFPWSVANSGSLSVTTLQKPRRFVHSYPAILLTPRVNLYVKFAIVVDDPTNVGRYIIGPMSDTIKIYPRAGYFDDDINMTGTQKYYYTWTTKYV